MIYKINHTFKPDVFVPVLAIRGNCEWMFDACKKMVVTSDNIMASVTSEEKINL